MTYTKICSHRFSNASRCRYRANVATVFSAVEDVYSSQERQRATLRVRSSALRLSSSSLERLSARIILEAARDRQLHRFTVTLRDYSEHDRERKAQGDVDRRVVCQEKARALCCL